MRSVLILISAICALGALGLNPAAAARSSKPKEIVVVGSKIKEPAKAFSAEKPHGSKATPKLYESAIKGRHFPSK